MYTLRRLAARNGEAVVPLLFDDGAEDGEGSFIDAYVSLPIQMLAFPCSGQGGQRDTYAPTSHCATCAHSAALH